MQFIAQYPLQAQTIVAKRLALDEYIVQQLWQDYDFEFSLNQELIVTLEVEARWAIREKLTEQTEVPNYLDIIYLPALEQIKPKAVKVFHK